MGQIAPGDDDRHQFPGRGHPGHGVAQAFPDAMNAAEKINKDGEKIKILYGTEAYFIDDLVESVTGEQDEPLNGTFICFDIETTGLSALKDKITEIGAVKVVNGEIVDTFSTGALPIYLHRYRRDIARDSARYQERQARHGSQLPASGQVQPPPRHRRRGDSRKNLHCSLRQAGS